MKLVRDDFLFSLKPVPVSWIRTK